MKSKRSLAQKTDFELRVRLFQLVEFARKDTQKLLRLLRNLEEILPKNSEEGDRLPDWASTFYFPIWVEEIRTRMNSISSIALSHASFREAYYLLPEPRLRLSRKEPPRKKSPRKKSPARKGKRR